MDVLKLLRMAWEDGQYTVLVYGGSKQVKKLPEGWQSMIDNAQHNEPGKYKWHEGYYTDRDGNVLVNDAKL